MAGVFGKDPNMKRKGSQQALNPVRYALWTLRDKAVQRRLALR